MKTEEQIEQIKSIQQDWIERMMKGDFTITSISQLSDFNTREVKFFISGKISAHCVMYSDSKNVYTIWTDNLRVVTTDEQGERIYKQLEGYTIAYDEEYIDKQIASLQERREQLMSVK